VTIGGQTFTTTTTYQAATALAGMSFTSAGTGVTSTTWFLDDVDAPVVQAMDRALDVLAARGAKVERITLPLMDAITTYGSIVSRVEAGAIHAQWMRERAGEYGIHISARMYAGYAIPATYYVEALARRGPLLQGFAKEVFE